MSKNLQTLNHNQRMAHWSKQVEACRNSGLTVAQWCSENNVAVSTYYSWQRKLFQNLVVPTDVCFAELPAAVPDSPKTVTIRCRDFTIELDSSTEPSVLRTVIEALKLC